jgi:S1-C subfamily serine protease
MLEPMLTTFSCEARVLFKSCPSPCVCVSVKKGVKMKTCGLFAICLLLFIPAQRADAQEATPRLTNDDVVKMVQAGLSADLIMTRIRKSETDFDTSPSALAGLPKRGVPNDVLLAMIERDPLGSNTSPSRKGTRLTAAAFQQLQTSVLTIWSEFGNGTGFIIDEAGLVLTSQHVVGPSEYVSVQFDSKRKLPAKVLASDPQVDVAVLWINLKALPEATVAPLADANQRKPSVVEGERLLTIGSSWPERKTFTTGLATKLNRRSIVSDINLNRSDAGDPLFNSLGEAVGITTYLYQDVSGAEVYGILRIEQTFTLIEHARRMMKRMTVPVARFLPVHPTAPFPFDEAKTVATARNFDLRRYSFEVGEFNVLIMTPAVRHHLATTAQDKKAFPESRKWAEFVRPDQPVLFIYAAPRSSESEFYKMRLFCGDREVEPILPAKVPRTPNDATIRGIYAYQPQAISADCGTVKLGIHSAGNPQKVKTRDLDRKVIARVDEDFSPYYEKHGRSSLALIESPNQTDKTLSKSGQEKRKWSEMSKSPK